MALGAELGYSFEGVTLQGWYLTCRYKVNCGSVQVSVTSPAGSLILIANDSLTKVQSSRADLFAFEMNTRPSPVRSGEIH